MNPYIYHSHSVPLSGRLPATLMVGWNIEIMFMFLLLGIIYAVPVVMNVLALGFWGWKY